MMFLLDSNPCIALMRAKNALVMARFAAHKLSELLLCAPVVAELRFGAESSQSPVLEMVKVNTFVSRFLQLPFDDAATFEYAAIRTDLAARGLIISEMDLLIASVARANDLTLVTHNTREFSRVPGLKLVDWEVP